MDLSTSSDEKQAQWIEYSRFKIHNPNSKFKVQNSTFKFKIQNANFKFLISNS